MLYFSRQIIPPFYCITLFRVDIYICIILSFPIYIFNETISINILMY